MLTSTTYLLTALQRAHRAALEPRLAELGLNYGSELALAEIWREEGMAQSELAVRLNVKPPSVTKGLRTLERAELVHRLGDAADARVSRVYLTARGRRLRPDLERAWREAERETLSSLSRREGAQLRRLLARAVDRGASPTGRC